MRKQKTLYIMLAVLAVVCIAAFAVTHYEQKQEQIKNAGSVILEISADDVTELAWTNEYGSYSFTKEESGWVYGPDTAFPVSEEKINDMLEQFGSFAAAFVIEDVEDYSQYGLDDPVATISITAGDTVYTVELGDYSKMDEQRYISIGDGNAYLVEHDPLDEYDAVLGDMILDDTVPEFDTATQITLTGAESYTVTRDEEGESICEDDVYFADGKPLDTDNVDDLVDTISSLDLTGYVTYNATDEELASYGLDNPDETVTVAYDVLDDDGNVTESGEVTVEVGSNAEEVAEYNEAVENGDETLPDVTRYVRVDSSQIIYTLTETEYETLTAVSYNDLRHQELFTADFTAATSIEVELDDVSYTFTYTPSDDDDEEGTWSYNDTEFDVSALEDALEAVEASEFSDESATGKREISLTVNLDNESFPTFELALYRLDGTNCVAVVDGEPTALVARSLAVDLIEAVNKITLAA